jgi:putative peptidoglycan lipid II flippase
MSSKPSGFEKHARTVTGLTVVSRMGGLLRDATMSRVFGISPLMDAFAFGFLVPNLFRRLFGEGVLSAAFLPEYTRLTDDDPATAALMARLLVGRSIMLLSAIVLLIEILLLFGVLDGVLEGHRLQLLAIMLPYAPMVCLVALMGAMLQAHGRFGPTAAAPIIMNVLFVASTLALLPLVSAGRLTSEAQISLVSASLLLAGMIQVFWSWRALRRLGIARSEPDSEVARATSSRVIRSALPMAIGLGVLQFNTLLDGIIASWPTLVGPTVPFLDVAYPLKEGSMSALAFASRLYEFPLGVFGIALATAIFPQLSRERDDLETFNSTLKRGIRLSFFIGLPATIGLLMVHRPLVAVILQGDAFTPADTARTGFILFGYASALWAYCVTHVLVRAFYARGEAMTAVKVAVGLVLLNLTLNLILIWTPLEVAGLAWSTAICAVVQVLILSQILSRRTGRLFDVDVRRSLLMTILLGALVFASCVILYMLMGALPENQSLLGQLIVLVILVPGGAVPFLAVAWWLRIPELSWLLGDRFLRP